MVKHEEDLVKGQRWFTGLSQVCAPLVCDAPKLGGSAEMKKGRQGRDRWTETER